MKKWRKEILAVGLAAVVILCFFIGHKPRTVYMAALDAIEEGDYEFAQSYLTYSDHPDAERLLSYMHKVPIKVTVSGTRGKYQEAYTYNLEGLATKRTVTSWSGSKTVAKIIYDEHGNMVGRTYDDELETTETYTYNEAGKLLHKYVSDNTGAFSQRDCKYDEGNHLLLDVRTDSKEQWVRYEYTYDEMGNRLTKRETDYEGTNIAIAYTYADCILQTETTITPTGVTVVKYNELGLWTAQEHTTLDGETTRSTCTYDEMGRPLREEHQGSRTKTYHYDVYGNCTRIWVEGANGSWINTAYTYNAEGKLAQTLTYNSVGEEIVTDYVYNKKGHLSEEYYRGPEGEWHNSFYSYDRAGNVEEVITESDRGNETVTLKWEVQYYPEGIPNRVVDIRRDFRVSIPKAG